MEPQYQETEDYNWRAPRRESSRSRGRRGGMGRMSERFREFNSSIGISRGPSVGPQEDYSERVRELVPKQKQTPKKRKRRPPSKEREIERERPSHRMERRHDRKRAKRERPPRSPKGRPKRTAKK